MQSLNSRQVTPSFVLTKGAENLIEKDLKQSRLRPELARESIKLAKFFWNSDEPLYISSSSMFYSPENSLDSSVRAQSQQFVKLDFL